MSHKLKRYLLKILPYALVSMALSLIYSFLEKGILGDYNNYPSTGNPYEFNALIPAIISFVVGLLIGVFEVFYLNKFFLKKSFLFKIIFKTLIYIFVIVLTIFVITTLSTAFELGFSPMAPEVVEYISKFFSSFAFWSVIIYFTSGIAFCLFFSEISDHIGQYVLLNFFTGKYNKPVEEERIFMFLDMKSSTTIAEKLGHVVYFNLLNEYYQDLSNSIINYGADIYQYVGDEIILTWKSDDKKNRLKCIECFFDMQDAISSRENKYISKYGMVPSFKIAIHLGKVTTGEIGKIKKDFVFTGDVLNTTSRIQELCNYYKVDILVSQALVDSLNVNSYYNTINLGEVSLKGKEEKITLFTISG